MSTSTNPSARAESRPAMHPAVARAGSILRTAEADLRGALRGAGATIPPATDGDALLALADDLSSLPAVARASDWYRAALSALLTACFAAAAEEVEARRQGRPS